MKKIVYKAVCPHCGKTNEVIAEQSEGFNEPEEFHCDYCGLEIGEIPAAAPPETRYLPDDEEEENN